MTNAEAFEYDFGIYATELWSMTEAQFLEWLNANCDRERPADMVVRCKDCKHNMRRGKPNTVCGLNIPIFDVYGFCSEGEWGDDPSHPFADDVMMGEWKDG